VLPRALAGQHSVTILDIAGICPECDGGLIEKSGALGLNSELGLPTEEIEYKLV
jgi:hypothetical protein